MMSSWGRFVAAVVIVVAGLSWSGPVSAHADLVETNPGNQAVLDEAPSEIVLTFSEAIDPVEPALRVVDADGNDVDLGTADQSRGDSTLGLAIDETLRDGTYVVAWQALSADSTTFAAPSRSLSEKQPLRDPGSSTNCSQQATIYRAVPFRSLSGASRATRASPSCSADCSQQWHSPDHSCRHAGSADSSWSAWRPAPPEPQP